MRFRLTGPSAQIEKDVDAPALPGRWRLKVDLGDSVPHTLEIVLRDHRDRRRDR